MKKMTLAFAFGFVIVFVLFQMCYEVKATDNPYGEPFDIEVTAYCIDGITATGCHTREGICAGKREWLGKTAIIYYEDEVLGIYEVKDCGGRAIREGRRLDIWLPTENECFEFGIKKCKVQIIDAEG